MKAHMRAVRTIYVTLGFWLTIGIGTAVAQETTHRGWEGGIDIYSGMRGGEAAFYIGGFGGNSTMALRFSALDETDVIPCSVGIMYEYAALRSRSSGIKPMAGVSANRIFSCASDNDRIRRPSPSIHGSSLLTAGIRVPIFTGRRAAGSIKILGFAGRMFGQTWVADAHTKGVVLGAVIHAP